MSIPTYQGAVGALRAAQACLEAELPAVLAAAGTGLGVSLDNVREFWRGEEIVANHNSPGVGIWAQTSRYMEPSGANLYEVEHEVVFSVVLAAANASAATVTEFTDSQHAYSHAVLYTLNRHLVTYGAAVGVWRFTTIDSTPLPVIEGESGQFFSITQCRGAISQRVARFEV